MKTIRFLTGFQRYAAGQVINLPAHAALTLISRGVAELLPAYQFTVPEEEPQLEDRKEPAPKPKTNHKPAKAPRKAKAKK